MLLDKYVLTKDFETLLSHHKDSRSSTSSATYTPPASFVKRVNHSMTRIDPLLKTLQVRPSPPEGLVQAYLIHIGDRSEANFRKILELKGVSRKQDQAHLVELFTIHRDSAPTGGKPLVQNSPLLTPLQLNNAANATSGAGVGLIASNAVLPGMPAKFDPASLGEKLLSAARDGVERMGPSSAAASGPGSGVPGAAVGTQEKTTINDNLKNIGKFFRRDIGAGTFGGLGARFGKRDVTPTGGHDEQR
jgi:hypothetical protein